MIKLYSNSFRFAVYIGFRVMTTAGNKMDQVDLSGFRIPYNSDDCKKDFSEKDPLKLFDSWFSLASKTDGIREANAMVVATAALSGKPSVRYVLLKSYGRDGFCFFTNYGSRKGKEIAENPNVSLLFYWDVLHRQVRIEGTAIKTDAEESEKYFHTRPRDSQLSAIASRQSTVIESKEIVIKKRQELEEKYADENITIPRPDYWGGYKVIPTSFEFWSGQTNRLHDRLRFRLPLTGESPDNKLSFQGENGWIYEYLSP